jgi:hypothetical protein
MAVRTGKPDTRTVPVTCYLVRDNPDQKAILIDRTGKGERREQCWIPRSMIFDREDYDGNKIQIWIPDWLAERERLE